MIIITYIRCYLYIAPPPTLKTFFFFIIGLYSNLSDENLLFSLKNLKMYIKS